uniref:N/A n=1 Tax=Ganoderma boninense TaxID=34458 RepID=A0A5K1JSW3_9APHY|nr:N/A [Ganoderma boninense]
MLGQRFVVVSSAEHAIDIMEKKSAIYSSRATLPVGGDMVGWSEALILEPYGERMRDMRKLISQVMGTTKRVEQLHPLVESEVRQFLAGLAGRADKLHQEVHHLAASIIVKIVYGYKSKGPGDRMIKAVDKAMEDLAVVLTPGAYLADVFPLLCYVPEWFPGAGWKRSVSQQRETFLAMVELPNKWVREQIAAGAALPSFSSTLLDGNIDPEREHLIKMTATALYGGGADTTVSSIMSFFLAMACFPEAQRKAQAEIDAVLGSERLPSVADKDRLPYVRALVLEVLRWLPVAPLAFPHKLIEDDVHAGYFMPKGSLVIVNVWKIFHDPALYADPMAFNPERFLASSGRAVERDPRDFAFGFGRRKCPGIFFAEASIFATVAQTLAVYSISKAADSNGNVVEPRVGTSGTNLSHPLPFQCKLTVRSYKAQALLDVIHETPSPFTGATMSSEYVSDTMTAPTIARFPFNQPSADITLRTSDRIDFYVHSPILSQASPMFADMLSLPQPSSVSQVAIADRPVVDVTEDSRALEMLLRLCYPVLKEKLDKLDDIVPVLQAAMKYDMEWPVYLLTSDLREIVPQSPLKVWAVACRCGLEDFAKEAAAMIMENAKGDSDSSSRRRRQPRRRISNTTAQAPLALLASTLQSPQYGKEVLRGISAGDYFRLREYLRTGDEQPTTNLLSPTIAIDPSHESQPPLPSSLIPLFPPPDVVLRCPDGAEFRAHTLSLVLLSPILAERVQALISPSPEPQGAANAVDSPQALPPLEMDVDSSILPTLLAIIYGGNAHLPSDLGVLSATLVAAKKLGFTGMAEAAQGLWNTLATATPFDAYFIAIDRSLVESARFAARKVLEGPIAGIYTPTMESSTALAYHHLLEYYQACASSINRRMDAAVAIWNGDLTNIQGSGPYFFNRGVRLENPADLKLCLREMVRRMSTDVPASTGCSFDLTLPALLRATSTMWPSELVAVYNEVTGALASISADLPRLVADAIAEVQLEIE